MKKPGAQLFFKCENLQKIGAFKARGATNAVALLSDEEARRGVVTHSSGNHAAALARAAQAAQHPCLHRDAVQLASGQAGLGASLWRRSDHVRTDTRGAGEHGTERRRTHRRDPHPSV